MTQYPRPTLDRRDEVAVVQELLRRRPAYLPEWLPQQGSNAWALLHIYGRMMQAVIERLNQAPDKNLLAFLDMLGISLIPAQAARAPVVFQPLPNGGNASVPAGARLGASRANGSGEQIFFEVEQAVALAAARLVEVKSVWPDRDAYADHTAEMAGGQPFTLFEAVQPMPHEFYLAHDTLFALRGDAQMEIEFELSGPGDVPLQVSWEFWDGQLWQPFAPFNSVDAPPSQDSTAGLTRSGVISLRVACGQAQKRSVHNIEDYWVRGRLVQPLPPDPARMLPEIDRIRVRTVINRQLTVEGSDDSLSCSGANLKLDQAFADGIQVDVSRTFYPLGPSPQPGSTFYFTNEEIFSKPGATVTVCVQMLALEPPTGATPLTEPSVTWEYWNGREWAQLIDPEVSFNFYDNNHFQFTVPLDMVATEVNGQEALWMRARLVEGNYGFTQTFNWDDGTGPNSIEVTTIVPPGVKEMQLGYTYRSPWERPEQCLTYNDFQFELHSRDIRWPGNFFSPFRPMAETTPTLYLGFDQPLPNDLIGLYLDIEEQTFDTAAVVWEAWDGATWRLLTVTDETDHLHRPGLVSFIAPDIKPRPSALLVEAEGSQLLTRDALKAAIFRPGDRIVIQKDDSREMATVQRVTAASIEVETPLAESYRGGTVTLAALPRFGQARDWVRVRLKEAGAPGKTQFNGLHLNATWASQIETISNEVLGSANGQPDQIFFFRRAPVLPGEVIEVRELEGPRAAVEYPMLREAALKQGLSEADLRPEFDKRSGKITAVWVRWQFRPHLYFSGPDDRHYTVERARGRLIFGGQRYPVAGANNIRARRYQAGGGLIGNVPAGAISQVLSGVLAQGVSNPRSAQGGADGETVRGVKRRGPQVLRHQGRSLAARDYEALAYEASPGVALARALPATAPNLRPASGWVTLIIVPQSQSPQPQPSAELRRQVHDYLAARAPMTLADGRIAVIGPTYLPVGVAALIAPGAPGEAGRVEQRVRARLASFLHPTTGGPERLGWPFGRNVYLSDVAAVVEMTPGVDYAEGLDLLLDDVPVGEQVAVPPDRIVTAGPVRIEMKAAER